MTTLCVVAGRRDRCHHDLIKAGPDGINLVRGEYYFPGDITVRFISDVERMRGLNIDYAIELGHGSFDGYEQEARVRGAKFVFGLKAAGIRQR